MTITGWRALVRPATYALRWDSAAAFAAAALAVVWFAGYRQPDPGPFLIDGARRAAMLLAMGAAFFVDDPAAITTASVPPTLLRRRAHALGIGYAATFGTWIVLMVLADARSGMTLPTLDLSIELGGLVLLGAATGCIVDRGGRAGGIAGCVTVFATAMTLPLMPERWTFLGGFPGEPVWSDAHLRWGVASILLALVVVVASRDPARRRLGMNRSAGPARQGK